MATTDLIQLTVRVLVTRALRKLGVVGTGQAALAEDINEAMADLNGMLGAWSVDRWTVWQLVDRSFVGTGAKTYTIGPTGTINIGERPDRIEAAYMIQLVPATNQPVSYPLKVLFSYQDYIRITLKNLSTFPWNIFYDPGFPLGTFYPWPIPTSAYEIHVLTKQIIDGYDSLDDVIYLPRPFYEAILYNLCIRLQTTYPTYQVSGEIRELAVAGLARITASNFAIAELKMPAWLVGAGSR